LNGKEQLLFRSVRCEAFSVMAFVNVGYYLGNGGLQNRKESICIIIRASVFHSRARHTAIVGPPHTLMSSGIQDSLLSVQGDRKLKLFTSV
jgi:hypothetical protein